MGAIKRPGDSDNTKYFFRFPGFFGPLGLIPALALLGVLLAFLYFGRHKSRYSKCNAVMARNVTRCPKWGAETGATADSPSDMTA